MKLTSGNYNFIIDAQVILDILGSSLDIVSLSENRGLFANNIGKVLFNEDIQIGVSRECEMSHTPFFDDEATILKNNFIELIARGKIVRGYTDYKTAYLYNSKLTASAQGEFCCKPRASASNMTIKNNNISLMKLMNGQEVIYIDNIVINNMNSNMKVHGVVENAYEYKEGIFTKRILKFPICFDIMNMLSGDFLGCVKDRLLSNGEYIVFKNIINT